jgi:hypothetical protein
MKLSRGRSENKSMLCDHVAGRTGSLDAHSKDGKGDCCEAFDWRDICIVQQPQNGPRWRPSPTQEQPLPCRQTFRSIQPRQNGAGCFCCQFRVVTSGGLSGTDPASPQKRPTPRKQRRRWRTAGLVPSCGTRSSCKARLPAVDGAGRIRQTCASHSCRPLGTHKEPGLHEAQYEPDPNERTFGVDTHVCDADATPDELR